MNRSAQTHVSFENYERQMKIPFIIYVHFDSLQIPQTNTKIFHKPCGFSYSIKCSYDDSLSQFEDYIGEDSPRVLWQKLEEKVTEICQKLRTKVDPQVLNDEEKRLVEKIQHCYFCAKILGEDRCEDFHPLTGQFLGTAHKKCRSKDKIPAFVPVIMHNFGKYGSHFLLKDLNKEELSSVFLVGKDQGFMRRFPSGTLRLIDLRQFMDEKIDDLEKILTDSKKRRLRKEFKAAFDLAKRKIHFPYSYMKHFEKFQDKIPNEAGFFDRLHDQDISKEDYKRSLDIWRCFGCKNMRDYFQIYLKSSVFLLEDIFENFRSLCLDKYHLDPAHYFTIASFSWDSMLRYTRVKLELLHDKNMINFIKNNIRGGINQCSKRHATANNKYCDNYDKRRPSTFIVYLDANNLGGWAMSQKLPFSDFTWLNKTEIQKIKREIYSFDENSEYGYFLEVDLEYPKRLHKSHNDLPFCSQHLSVPPPPTASFFAGEKNVLTFYDKRKYVIEYRTLKQCLENGLVLTKIHRVLKFKQSKWLEPYMTYNTTLRAQAKNDFETKLYKLLNNSVYGKTIQKSSTDKPIYAGFSILELSKKFMYDFHYNVMLQKYENINLLYIDTDGVIYEIQTRDYFNDIKSDSTFLSLMDTSNLESKWGVPQINKKAVGKMKDEYDGRIIREFFSLGAKRYFLDVEGEEIKKAAGMKKYVKAMYISREDYENSVLYDKRVSRNYVETEATNHEVVSKPVRKTMLSPGDKKRFVLLDKVNTLAWGFEAE